MCDSCEVLNINGVNTHETGCPKSWKDTEISCHECGYEFLPEEQFDHICRDCIQSHDLAYFENEFSEDIL